MDIWVAIRKPDVKLLNIWDGGGNLWPEDEAEGYVDYVNYRTWRLDGVEGPEEDDGGEFLFKEPTENLSVKDIVKAVIDFIYDNDPVDYVIVQGFEEEV